MVLLIILLAAFIFVLSYSLHKPISRAIPTSQRLAAAKKITYRGIPTILKIQALTIAAPIEYLGNTAAGNMAAPSLVGDAGWYKYGPLPGDVGTAVIAGHVVGPKGEPAIFYRLDNLQVGDSVQVVDGKGQIATFTVRQKKTYSQTEQPSEVFNSGSGVHLNLITCAGDWDSNEHHYLNRLVVFTDLISEPKSSF